MKKAWPTFPLNSMMFLISYLCILLVSYCNVCDVRSVFRLICTQEAHTKIILMAGWGGWGRMWTPGLHPREDIYPSMPLYLFSRRLKNKQWKTLLSALIIFSISVFDLLQQRLYWWHSRKRRKAHHYGANSSMLDMCSGKLVVFVLQFVVICVSLCY